MFIKEVFGDYDPSTLDEEILTTVYQFMENDLNLSETSRQLFVHRNTLVYRLEKLQKTKMCIRDRVSSEPNFMASMPWATA